YFASPIAYIVIGFYALIFGFFFYSLVLYFDRQSMQMMGLGGGAPAGNINENLIRPSFLNPMVVFLFVLPMITMRTYSEEKRSGTIELLLTSPLTDFEIIMGKFLGAMGLFCAMLLVTLIDFAILFRLPGTAVDGRLLHLARVADLESDEEPGGGRVHDLRDLPGAVDRRLVRRV